MLRDIIISHFFIRDKPIKRWRDKKTGRFVSGNMFRTTFGIKQMPLNRKYYGVTFYAWSKEPLNLQQINKLYRVFVHQLTKFLGYGEHDWWFSIFEQTNFEMRLRPELIGKWRFKVEHKGVTFYGREGKI